MHCPHCGTSNPAQARFCLGCGRALVEGLVCTTCYTLLPLQARYCFYCGAIVVPLVRQSGAPGPAPAPVPQQAGPALDSLPPPRPMQDMLVSLQSYLPHELYEPLERRPTEQDLAQARDHLASLLHTTKTYLPQPVVQRPQPAGVPRGGMARGVFLFGDVSGFTPLSEQLKKLGQVGAERITEIINGLFTELVQVLFAHGGSLLKFGGDALLGLFPAETDEQMAAGALQAIQAGLAMQQVMQQPHFAEIDAGGEIRALRIKCGISAGAYFAAHIGTKQSMAYVTTGHTVNRAEQAEGHAEPGDVVIAQEVYDLASSGINVAPPNKDPVAGFFRVTGAPDLEDSAARAGLAETRPILAGPPDGPADGQIGDPGQISDLVDRLDRLAPYLPAELLSRIVTNPWDPSITPDYRPVTVMFANYVGIGDLIDDMGERNPEQIARHLNDYFVHMARIVEKYEGSLARMDQYSVGDRLVIFFGAPRAHEDDPVRAVRTALEMQEATRQHFAALQTAEGIYRFRQRIGINSGHLFAGNAGAVDLRQEYTLMGDDINMAARLMSMAEFGTRVGEILISDQSKEKVNAYFDLEDRGELQVKGKEVLIPTFKVLGRRQTIGQTRGLAGSQAPLVDRVDELQALVACGQGLLSDRGQIVSLIGSSGLGKSRLKRELQDALSGDRAGGKAGNTITWIEGQALSFSERMSYWLATQMLYGTLGLGADTDENDTLLALWEKGEALLGKEAAREAMPFLAHVMGLPLQGEWARWVEELDPQVRQKQVFWAAREFFAAAARQQPMVIALDDLHWADEASSALVENLFEVTDRAPLMLCLVFRRRSDKVCWRLRDKAASTYAHRYTEVELERLSEEHSRELLSKLVPGAGFDAPVEEQILEKTAGNPFYLEEVIRSLIESGALVPDADNAGLWQVTSEINRIQVPDTLEGAILSRIDHLTEDARQVLQMAAVIGRQFQAQVLAGLIQAESEMKMWLAQLERSNLIRQAQLDPEPVYAFPDALVQEVAYKSLLIQRRQKFHRRAGETMEVLFAGQVEQQCQLLAYHFGLSDDQAQAIHYLDMAGRKAQAEFANNTALDHYASLLDLLGEAEGTWEARYDVLARQQKILGLIGRQEERQASLDTMLALAQAHEDIERIAGTLNEMADLDQWTGRYARAEEYARQALDLNTEEGNLQGQATALHLLGVLGYYQGDYAGARPLLEQAVSLRQETGDPEGEAWSRMYLGMIHFFEGDYGQAAQLHESALETAQARQDWFQEGIHLTNAARVSLRLGDYERALDQFSQSLEMKTRVGDRTGQGFSLYHMGLVHVYQGRYDEAEATFQDSFDLRRQIDDERGVGYSLYGLGLVALGRGLFSQAEEHFRQAYQIHGELGAKAEAIVDLSFLGQACLGAGETARAAEASGQAIALLAEQKTVEEVQQIYFNHYRVLEAQGDPSASGFLQMAHDAMLAQAERIGDARKRQAFLSWVKVNQEIAAARES